MDWRRTASACLLATTVAAAAGANSWDVAPGLAGVPPREDPAAQHEDAAAQPTCLQCHTTAAPEPDPAATLELRGLPEHYLPGVRYRLRLAIEHDDPDRLRWGFALTAVAPGRADAAGRLLAPDVQNTRVQAQGGRDTLVHTYPGTGIGRAGGQTWTFDWVAPLRDVGEIAFFANVVAADADGTESGDIVYGTASGPLAVTSGPASAREAASDAPDDEPEASPAGSTP